MADVNENQPQPAEEQNPASQAQPVDETAEASETLEAKEGETAPTDGEGQAESEEKAEQKPKGVGKKIGKLTRKLTEKNREIEYLRAQLEKSLSSKQAEPSEQKPKAPTGKPNPNDFETHEDYLDARDEWRDQQREARSREQALKSEVESKVQSFKEKAQAFAKEHPDYDELLEGVNDIRLSYAVNEAVLKHGPELAYELAKDPEELERICAMTPFDAAEAIGEIRARMKASKSEPKPETKTTKAPKPPTPIASKSAPVRKSISDENLSFQEYVRLRRDQMRKRP